MHDFDAPNAEDYEYGYQYDSYYEPFTLPTDLFTNHEAVNWLISLQKMGNRVKKWNTRLCIVSLTVLFFHFLVISRRRMWTSAINILMIGISFCDIFIIGKTLGDHIYEDVYWTDCWPRDTYICSVVILLSEFYVSIVFRVSPFLGLSMAMIRVAVLYFPFSSRISGLSKRKVGVKIFIILMIISGIVSVWYYSRFTLVKDGVWLPEEKCGFPPTYKPIRYFRTVGRKILISQMLSKKLYALIDGAFNIIPAILYPVVTVILVIRICKIRRNRSHLKSRRENAERDHTSTLVVLMSISFSISQIPFGISVWIDEMFQFNAVLDSFIYNSKEITSTLFTLNSTLHCLIFAALSSQYRDVAWDLTGFIGRRIMKARKQNVISHTEGTIAVS